MIPRRTITAVLALAVAAAALLSAGADAMPGFARKYKMSCTTCHAPFPRLKDFGNEFAGRGFRLEDGQEPKRAYVDTGDPLLVLQKAPPIGFRLEGFASWKEGEQAEFDQEFPWSWKIISGGPISSKAAYYFYFLIERGEVEGLEDAYIQINDIFGTPVTFMFGQFQVCDPMFKREARLERTDYEIYKTRVGASGLNLTYDRGAILTGTGPGAVDYVFQVVNGNGIPHADDRKNFDRDKYKNPSLRLARGFGPVYAGLFGYYGKQEGEVWDDSGNDTGTTACNETWYAGADFSSMLGSHFELNLQYLGRGDENPFFLSEADRYYHTRGGFAELHWFPQGVNGRWAASGLYNLVRSDDEAIELQSLSVTGNYLLARNLRGLAEVAYEFDRERARVTLGLISAF